MPRTPKQDDLLAAARKSQEIMADAIRTWVETVRTATPRLSSVYAPLAERLPKVPSMSVSLSGKLPRPHEAVASAYDLAERLLASQRKFAEDVVKAYKPLMPGYSATAPQARTDVAPQEARTEAAPQEKAAESVPQEAAAQVTPKVAPAKPAAAKPAAAKAAAAKAATKAAAVPRTPKSTTASRAPKAPAAKRTPRSTDAG